MIRTASRQLLSPMAIPSPSWALQATAVFALAFYMNAVCWPIVPPDMSMFQRPWLEHIIAHGPVGAFAHPFSNYTPTYLYLLAAASPLHPLISSMSLIKLVSVLGTIFATLAVADLVKALGGRPRHAILLLILPTTVINAAVLAQCDAFWAGACVLAVSAMVRGWTVRSLIWCGVAVAFKAQAIFIAPFVIGAMIGRRAPYWQWSIPGLTFAALMLPAWAAGWPAQHLAMIYPSQPGWIPFPGDLANPWVFASAWARTSAQDFYWVGYLGAGIAAVLVAGLTRSAVNKPRAMLFLAVVSAIAIPYCLPKMLERYYFLADILSLGLALALRTRSSILIAVAVQIASLTSFVSYWYFISPAYPTMVGAVLITAAVVLALSNARQPGGESRLKPRAIHNRLATSEARKD